IVIIIFHLFFPLFKLYDICDKIRDVKYHKLPPSTLIEYQSSSPVSCTQNSCPQQIPKDQCNPNTSSFREHIGCISGADDVSLVDDEFTSPISQERVSESLQWTQQAVHVSSEALKFDISSEIELHQSTPSIATLGVVSDFSTVDANLSRKIVITPIECIVDVSDASEILCLKSLVPTDDQHVLDDDEQREMHSSLKEWHGSCGKVELVLESQELVTNDLPQEMLNYEKIPRDPSLESLVEEPSLFPVIPSSTVIEETKNSGEIYPLNDSSYIHEDINNLKRNSASFGDLPVDVFIEICYHLPPTSLFALIGVNKKFRNWLKSTTSHITTDIWRISRIKFITYLPRPPPAGIDEITYIRLAMLEKGCQFCGTKSMTPKVYWAFRVRSCETCLRKRTTTPENLPQWAKSPIDISTIVPYEKVSVPNSNTGAKMVTYMNSQLEAAHREFASTPPKHRTNWVLKKKSWVSQVLTNVQKRERLDELYCKKKSSEDSKTFKALVEEFRNIKDEKGQKRYHEKYMVQLPSYIEAKEAYKAPFMINPWPTFIARMKSEYSDLMKKTVRLEQITNRILSLVTSHDTLAADLKGCLNLVKKQFGSEDTELFMCKLCWKSKRLYHYEAICRHLTSDRHSIGRVDNERMIEVNRDRVKNVLP
ncbi:5325_t:CDS:2, partial [Acaulospora morrowiae]